MLQGLLYATQPQVINLLQIYSYFGARLLIRCIIAHQKQQKDVNLKQFQL